MEICRVGKLQYQLYGVTSICEYIASVLVRYDSPDLYSLVISFVPLCPWREFVCLVGYMNGVYRIQVHDIDVTAAYSSIL